MGQVLSNTGGQKQPRLSIIVFFFFFLFASYSKGKLLATLKKVKWEKRPLIIFPSLMY